MTVEELKKAIEKISLVINAAAVNKKGNESNDNRRV